MRPWVILINAPLYPQGACTFWLDTIQQRLIRRVFLNLRFDSLRLVAIGTRSNGLYRLGGIHGGCIMDWLLLGIFSFMTLTIIAHANLGRDALIVFVGMLGGLVIEAWGTQTNLWHYFTAERPPLWIIPAWPIASLSIDRITRGLGWGAKRLFATLKERGQGGHGGRTFDTLAPTMYKYLYWIIFIGFFGLMLYFVAPTFGKSYTVIALALVALLTLTPTDHHYAVLTFIAGAGLGYFLELWGTTRQCWTYYTFQTPPFFAVLAHGMAAVAFWRAGLMVKLVWGKIATQVFQKNKKIYFPGSFA